MKKVWKIVGIVLGSAVLLALLFFLVIVCEAFFGFNDDYSAEDVGEYEAYLDFPLSAREFMPALSDCGEYQKAGLSRRERVQFIFGHHSVCLFLRYGEEEYARAKKQIEARYRFLEKTDTTFRDISGSICGYRVRMITTGDNYSDVKDGKFIGFNEDTNTILYAYYYDDDLDYIDDLDKTLKDYFFIPKDWRS